MILRSGPDQRHTADVDVLDAFFAADAASGGLAKWVKIADDEVDWLNSSVAQGSKVIRPIATRQQPAMNSRMQCLDPPIEKFGHAGNRRYVDDRKPRCSERASRTAGGYQFDPACSQGCGKGGEAGLVAD